MTKIGKLRTVLNFFITLIAFGSTAIAQDVEVNASLSETNIFTGEQVTLQISISGTSMGSVQQPELPDIEGLRWIRGSTQSGTSYTIANGKPSVTYSFGYLLLAQEPGEYAVPSLTVDVDGQAFETAPVNFKILDPDIIDSGEADRAPDIYVRLEPSVVEPVVGQQVVADIVLYFKSGIEVSSYQPSQGWKAEGFWKEELQYPQRAQTTSTIISGTRYNRAGLLQYAIFPTKSGELTISPFEISIAVRQQRSSREPFGFGLGQERMVLETQPVTLNVKQLPELGNATFLGAVGSFDVSRNINLTSALVGESIEITTQISGNGNVPLINKPDYNFPEGLEKYTPQESSEISRLNRVISGTRTFTDILVPRNAGTFTIPEERVAYFDPNRNRYVVETLPELVFTAERDPDAVTIAENDIRFDVEPVTGLASWQSANVESLIEKTWVWILIFLPFLSTILAWGFKKHQQKMNTDVAFARSKKAATNAHKTLVKAEETDEVKEGYHYIEKALVQFITDKLNLPPAGISNKELILEVSMFADEEFVAELKRILNKCESIAYAPNVTQQNLDADIEHTKVLIKTIGKLA